MKKGVLRNFTKFIGNLLCQSLCIIKETLARGISYEFFEISKNTFFHRAPSVAASESNRYSFIQLEQIHQIECFVFLAYS